MDMVYKQFMGLKTPIKSEADRLLEESFKEIYNVLADFVFPITSNQKANIREFIAYCKQSNPEHDYFWNWMQEKGFTLLTDLDKRLPNTDEVLDFLAYRKMVLEMDAMNGSIEMFFLSITEFLVSVTEFLSAYFETAAGMQVFPDKEHIQLPSKEIPYTIKNHWEYMQSSAPYGAGLLFYI